MLSITCRDGSVVDTGLTGYEATNFLILDGHGFCGRCASSIQNRHCTGIDTRRPTLGAEPIGGSGMRSATGGTPCPCGPKCWGKLMSNGMCDCRDCKDEVSSMRSATGEGKNLVATAVNWLTNII